MATQATQDWKANWERQQREQEARSRVERNIALTRLLAAGVTTVIATYSGSSDSGGIDSVRTVPNVKGILSEPVNSVKNPTTDQMAEAVVEGLADPHARVTTIEDAISDVMDAKLESEHGGWEINAGGSGTITFHLATGRIKVDHTYGGQGCDDDDDDY
jgi:hypothetical protein